MKKTSGMIVLTRRHGESIIIDDDIKITILPSRRGQVRIGVDAPRDIPVHREEIYKKICDRLAGEYK